MLFQNLLVKLFVSLVLTVVLTLGGMFTIRVKISPAYAADLYKPGLLRFFGNSYNRQSYDNLVAVNSSTDWYKIDKDLIDALRIAHDSTEEFAAAELNDWVDNLMKKVDEKFLNWYFSYWNQKAQEFGSPFAWAAFKIDSSLKIIRKEDEKSLNASQILQKRMIEDFQSKFTEQVLDEESKAELVKVTERVGRNYASALGMKLASIKYSYNLSDGEWEKYLNDLASLIYDTGNSKNSLEIDSAAANLGNKLLIISTAVGTKLAVNFALKAGVKIAGKASGAIVAKIGAQLIDPLLAVGILIWDVWDYDKMVKKSRPELRQNILDYLEEVKWSILNSPENSIMAAIEQVEGKIITGLSSRQVMKAS